MVGGARPMASPVSGQSSTTEVFSLEVAVKSKGNAARV